jgi:hypothetical protein
MAIRGIEHGQDVVKGHTLRVWRKRRGKAGQKNPPKAHYHGLKPVACPCTFFERRIFGTPKARKPFSKDARPWCDQKPKFLTHPRLERRGFLAF